MDRRLWWIAIALLALLGLAAPLASAQQAQTVNVEISGVVLEVPDELPGVYEAGLEVTTQASGGHCACRQTTVDLQAREVPDVVDAVVFSPSAYAVDWTNEQTWGGHGHAKAVHVTIGVSEIPEDASMIALTVDADVDSSNQLVQDRVQPTQLALPHPSDAEAEQSPAANSSAESSDGDEQALPMAGTQSAGHAEDEDTGGLALGTGAATAGLALAGLSVHRYRQRS